MTDERLKIIVTLHSLYNESESSVGQAMSYQARVPKPFICVRRLKFFPLPRGEMHPTRCHREWPATVNRGQSRFFDFVCVPNILDAFNPQESQVTSLSLVISTMA